MAFEQDTMPAWGGILTTSTTELDIADWKMQRVLSTPMDELNNILSRFIEFAKREKMKGKYFLKEDLMQAYVAINFLMG